jgi:hypothetical protein
MRDCDEGEKESDEAHDAEEHQQDTLLRRMWCRRGVVAAHDPFEHHHPSEDYTAVRHVPQGNQWSNQHGPGALRTDYFWDHFQGLRMALECR